MLAKKFRLPIQEWRKEKKETVSRKNDFFAVKFRANNLKFSRFGAVVSSKVSKSAVVRNKIKRTIFDFIRLKKIYQRAGRDFLIIALSRASRLKKEEIEKQLEQILL